MKTLTATQLHDLRVQRTALKGNLDRATEALRANPTDRATVAWFAEATLRLKDLDEVWSILGIFE